MCLCVDVDDVCCLSECLDDVENGTDKESCVRRFWRCKFGQFVAVVPELRVEVWANNANSFGEVRVDDLR